MLGVEVRETMAWDINRTGDVLLCAGVSGIVALILNTLGCSYPWYWVFLGFWLPPAGTAIALSYIKVKPAGKAVVVTGCDHGFGHALALHLHNLGFLVFAGCLNPDGEGAKVLKEIHSTRLIVLSMDVTKQDHLDKAVQEVKRLLPQDDALWGLVNNAGVTAWGLTDWMPLSSYKRVLDVNVLGLIAATKAFLPLIRRSKGRVVNMSSVAGSMGVALVSGYVASKHAVKGFSDTLRIEMRPWGVAVSVVEPGNYSAATRIITPEVVAKTGAAMWDNLAEDVRADYGKEYFDYTVSRTQQIASTGDRDIMPVLHAITEALTQRFPRACYRVINTFFFFVMAVTYLPQWIDDCLRDVTSALVAKVRTSSPPPVPAALRYA